MTSPMGAAGFQPDPNPLFAHKPFADQAKSYVRSFDIRFQVLVLLLASLLTAFTSGYLIASIARHWPESIDNPKYFNNATSVVATLATNQYQLSPILALVAFFTALIPYGYVWIFRLVTYGAGALGYFARILPSSPIQPTPEQQIYLKLYSFDYWCLKHIVPVLAGMILLSLTLSHWAYKKQTHVRLLGPYNLPMSTRKIRHLEILGKLTEVVVIFIALMATLWATTVISLTMTSGSHIADPYSVSHQAASAQSKYLLPLLLIAIIASVSLRYHTLAPLGLAFLCAIILGVESKITPSFHIFPFMTVPSILARISNASIADPFWLAIIAYLPLIALCIHIAIKLNDWSEKTAISRSP